ncbi:MAG TPA: ABC transporter permease, partial [Thermoanaerobaculia bacterium]|nr:ABC transporter permease [Thermoanaerobaculia bacterium]
MIHDVRLAVRRLLRARGFTLASVVTLGAGIAATASIFTLASALLLRPLPYRDSARLVHLWEVREAKNYARSEASYPDFQDWRAESRTVETFAGYSWPRVTLRGGAGAEQLQAARVTDSFFQVLGVSAALGRTLDATTPQSVLLSDGIWHRRFGADRAIVGKTVNIDGEAFGVAGVLPPSFHFAPSRGADLWLPVQPTERMRTARAMRWLNVVAKLKPGVSAAAAEQELAAIAARIAREHPDSNRGTSVQVVPLREQFLGPIRMPVLVLGCAALLVLLIACANVASLAIGRAARHQKDLSVLLALGARRSGIVRLLVAEAVVLSMAGAVVGVPLGMAALRALVAAMPANMIALLPALQTITLDARAA